MGLSRRNFMVPIPRFATWDAFNAHLEEQGRRRQAGFVRGQSETIGNRLARDLAAMTHHANIIKMNGDIYRLGQSRARKAEAST